MIHFAGRSTEVLPGETVLECLERHGFQMPSSCRSGVCQSCVLKAGAGQIPPASQAGLKRAWRETNYFLPCVCRPLGDLLVDVCTAAPTFEARVLRTEELGPGVFGIWLSRPEGLDFRAGQFVHVIRMEDRVMRPYSIASMPETGELELHVAVIPGGRISGWLSQAEGIRVLVRGPYGECCYMERDLLQPIVLAGTGTGLSPLLGVLRTALVSGHRGPIRLYHGARNFLGLYAAHLLRELETYYSNLTVVFSVLEMYGTTANGRRVRAQPLDEAVFRDIPDLRGYGVYLCGHPETVHKLKKRAYLAGASLDEIHSDPFAFAPAAPMASTSLP